MPEVILSEYVEPELDAIWQYIALDNMDAADRFVEAAYGTFQMLARMPAWAAPVNSGKRSCATFARSG
jgi:plasmid stabilization system protein ParE